MATSRYTRAPLIELGTQFGTSRAIMTIRQAIKRGTLTFTTQLARGAERLDTMSGVIYGDSRYWWILAAASDIGWGMQVPTGTVINVPDLIDVLQLIR